MFTSNISSNQGMGISFESCVACDWGCTGCKNQCSNECSGYCGGNCTGICASTCSGSCLGCTMNCSNNCANGPGWMSWDPNSNIS